LAKSPVRPRDSARKVNGHSKRGLCHRLRKHRTDCEDTYSIPKTVRIVDVWKKIALYVDNRLQSASALQARFGQVDLPNDDVGVRARFIKMLVVERFTLVNMNSTDGPETIKIFGAKNVRYSTRGRSDKNLFRRLSGRQRMLPEGELKQYFTACGTPVGR
jgi:hypothetical protein